MNLRHGDVVRMTSYTRIKVSDKKKVAVFMLLGEENKDRTKPLDLKKRLNDLGWVRASTGRKKR